jgi:hypothetical protein
MEERRKKTRSAMRSAWGVGSICLQPSALVLLAFIFFRRGDSQDDCRTDLLFRSLTSQDDCRTTVGLLVLPSVSFPVRFHQFLFGLDHLLEAVAHGLLLEAFEVWLAGDDPGAVPDVAQA